MTGIMIQCMGIVAPLLVVITLLASPAGIGGRILFTPVLNLIGELNWKEASAASQALIAASQLASVKRKSVPVGRRSYFFHVSVI